MLGFSTFLALVSAAQLFQWFVAPALDNSAAEAKVRQEETAFLDTFNRRVAQSASMRIWGWQSETAAGWGLVTLVYSEDAEETERKAYLWCVDPRDGTSVRLKSLAEFVDDYLLRDTPAARKS